MYTLEEVKKATLEYFGGDDLTSNVWIDKYCLKGNEGELLEDSPDMMYKRLAKEFSRIEQKYPNPISYDEILEKLSSWSIIPGGSLLYGIGNDFAISSLGNCFVIGNNADSYGGICTLDQEQVQLMKRRAGVGHDISHLRAKGVPTTNSAKTSSGIVPFMERYSNSTREVAQDGRRGALMLSCDIEHPQAEDFITAKDDTTKVTGANISVKVSDEFMGRALKMGAHKEMGLWRKLVYQAWKSAEPGLLFWDKIKSESIPSCYGPDWQEVSTNPCGEIPLCPYDSCRLLSINLTKYVLNPFTKDAIMDWESFERDCYIAQKLMDDVIDLEEEKINKILKKIEDDPEDEQIKAIEKNLWLKIKEKLLQGRRTGLSGIGLADTLAMLNISYSSGIDMAESIYKTLAISAYKSSIDMAKDRGVFPIWDFNVDNDNPFLKRIYEQLKDDDWFQCQATGRRNIALLTIPPSGTISLLAGLSSGIEPVYQLSYKRRRKVEPNHPNVSFTDKNGDCWEEYNVVHPKIILWYQELLNKEVDEGIEDYTVEQSKFLLNKRTNEQLEELFKKSPYHGSTAYELNPLDRVKMQGVIQKWVDHSISSTINLPEAATKEDVSKIYLEAWKQGLKGITIYREGSRDGVLYTDKTKDNTTFKTNNAPKRPKVLAGQVFTPTTHGNEYIVIVGLMDGKPYEVFACKNTWNLKGTYDCSIIKKSRGRYDVDIKDKLLIEDITSEMSQIEEDKTRLISVSLRHGADIKFLVEQLNKAKGNGFQAFSKVVARTLKRYIKDEEKVTGATCDSCGSDRLIYKDGCVECESCGIQHC